MLFIIENIADLKSFFIIFFFVFYSFLAPITEPSIGDLKRILKGNNCLILIIVWISEFVYFVVTVLNTVPQIVYQ